MMIGLHLGDVGMAGVAIDTVEDMKVSAGSCECLQLWFVSVSISDLGTIVLTGSVQRNSVG